jgi:Concanavalin A-like lectin/glucanases superfamily/Ig domain of plant-specific actin-binding protein
VPSALVLVLALVTAAWAASPAAATSSRLNHIRPKVRFRPRIVGKPRVGVALRATRGIWTSRPVSYRYRWYRCPAGRARCRRIAGATRSRYTPSSRDIGRTLRVTVTASNATGFGRATSRRTRVVRASRTRRVVQPIPPAVTSYPTVSGTARDGQTLTAATGSWTGTTPIAYAYQWLRCDSRGGNCNAIGGATATSYMLTSTDVGRTIEVTVRASNTAGSATAASAPTAVVVPPPGLVALWHMDETSGSTMFDSVGSHNGTLHSTQTGLAGFTGTAFGFNGSSSYVSVPSTADLNPGSADITFTIHLKTSGTPPPPPADWDIFRKGLYTSGAEYKMEFQQTGQASCGFEGTRGYAELVAGPKINDGQWHTISCAKTSSVIQVVVDGQAFSKAANIGSIANTTNVAVGARPGSDWYQGQLDEASIQIG